jgi:hypothetical protein
VSVPRTCLSEELLESPNEMRVRETPASAVCAAVGVYWAPLYRYVEPDGATRVRKQE